MPRQFDAYYSALNAVWNVGTLPANVSGTAFLPGDATATKLAALATWAMTNGQGQVLVPAWKIINAVAAADWPASGTAQYTQLWNLLDTGTIDGSPGAPATSLLASIFSGKATTLAALSALQKTYLTPWWQAPQANGGAGLVQAPTQWDAVLAGLIANPNTGKPAAYIYQTANPRRFNLNIAVDISYLPSSDGLTASGAAVFTDIAFGGVAVTANDILVQAVKRIANVLLPGDAALVALGG